METATNEKQKTRVVRMVKQKVKVIAKKEAEIITANKNQVKAELRHSEIMGDKNYISASVTLVEEESKRMTYADVAPGSAFVHIFKNGEMVGNIYVNIFTDGTFKVITKGKGARPSEEVD